MVVTQSKKIIGYECQQNYNITTIQEIIPYKLDFLRCYSKTIEGETFAAGAIKNDRMVCFINSQFKTIGVDLQ